MHEKVLSRGAVQLLNRIESLRSPALLGWTLAGGTGLALQYGHRKSDDFDFFRCDGMNTDALHVAAHAIGRYETLQEGPDTLTIRLRGVKLSFFNVRDPFLDPPVPYRFFSIVPAGEIGLMKLAAISGRGSRKDFIDLHAILHRGESLQALLDRMPEKYGADRVNAYHILKSLAYFEDADREPMPRMLEPFDWKACKAFFLREAHALAVPLT